VADWSTDEHESAIAVPAGMRTGVWANRSRVTYSPHEFTIDFVRADPFESGGTVVARVSGSPLFISDLIDRLQTVWQTWAERVLPREARGDDEVPDGST
jgi:hypothetical protein